MDRFVIGFAAALLFSPNVLADSLDGIWVSNGYGLLAEIKGDEVKAFEITAVSCIPAWTAKKQPQAMDGVEAVLRLDRQPVTILVTSGNSPNVKFFGSRGAASRIEFRRVTKRPEVCDTKTADTPLTNFDAFWTTYAEQYPFFAMKGIDWQAVRDKYRPQITDKATGKELFDILKTMIEPLHDAHTYLIREGSNRQVFQGWRAGVDRLNDADKKKIASIIETKYLHGKLRSWCRNRLSYGVTQDAIGYVSITAFAGYTFNNEFEAGSKALESALDEIFQDAQKLRGLIVDVRINGGGSDVYGVAVASRLAPKEYLAFAKVARNDPRDPAHFTPAQDSFATVSPRPHFHGKVVELTGGNSVSAAETFTMALMGRTPAVQRIGENTQGVFSDILGRRLPNGWRFGLPNEIFLTKDGKSFDGPGIPPDIRMPVFPKEDLKVERDGAMEKALEILRR
jgi:hypothetical protein